MSNLSFTMDAQELRNGKKPVKHNCWICMDRGFVEYDKVVGEIKYRGMAYCICDAGKQFKYDGSLCKDHKTDYFMPCITDFFPEEILQQEAEHNRIEYDKDYVAEQLAF
jgi:hypothetical protein